MLVRDHPPTVQCPVCDRLYKPILGADRSFPQRLARWRLGVPFEVAWPNTAPNIRQQLTDGICSDHCERQRNEELAHERGIA